MLLKKIHLKSVTSFFLAVILFIGSLSAVCFIDCASADTSATEYSESTDEIVNPAAGFYKAITAKLRRGVSDAPVGEYTIQYYARDFGLYHLLFDLSDFSANAGGADAEIDENALASAAKVFGFLRKNKIGAIVRFDYNRNGNKNPDGSYINAEPSLELLLKHVQSVSRVITEYSDVILGVESGMLGPWGEQHSTTLGNPDVSNKLTYYRLVETWLNNTPKKIGITVRRPLYFTYWVNEKYSLDLNVSDLSYFDASEYENAERVGVYNDGYLGSSSDLGTFTDRAAETAFIGRQAERTFYGGELVADSKTGLLGEYNSVSYLEKEGFVTHTSYVNIDWNYNVFNEYKKRTYSGADELYNGKTSEFTFVKNRLGYRFYLSRSEDATVSETGEATFKFTIANAGFARILCATRSELVFTDGVNTVTTDCNVDLSQIPSANDKTFEVTVEVPEQLSAGEFDVYLKFYTAYGAEIRLANDVSICAPERSGVKISSVKKPVPVKTLADVAVTKQPSKTVYVKGDQLDLTGLEITASYSDGTVAAVAVTKDMLSGYDMLSEGTQEVTVTYSENDVTKTTSFVITVKNLSVTLTKITVVYSGKEYYVNEVLDLNELTVLAEYSDGTTAPVAVTREMLSGGDTSVVGKQTVAVTYQGKTATFEITVKPSPTPTDPVEQAPSNTKTIVIICVAVAAAVACAAIVCVLLRRKKK